MSAPPLNAYAIVVDAARDNCAVAKETIPAGTELAVGGRPLRVLSDVPPGHRFALRDIPAGEYLLQYGQPWATSRGIRQGERITGANVEDRIPAPALPPADWVAPPPAYVPEDRRLTFAGFRRPDGRVGTRNYVLVLPTSLCPSETARQMAQEIDLDRGLMSAYPHVDGVVSTPHTEGCAVAGGTTTDVQLRTLCGYLRHPNVAAAIVLDQGCENLPVPVVRAYLESRWPDVRKPIAWLSMQELGGTAATLAKGREVILSFLPAANRVTREDVPVGELLLGTECGGSDAFSGLSANPVLGGAADRVIRHGGAAILSEVPEMVGAEQLLLARCRDRVVAEALLAAVAWYEQYGRQHGVDMQANPSAGNKAGGLLNIYIKSLGAIAKGGTTRIEEVIAYALQPCRKGLVVMQGPGNDLESVTGLVGAGATVVGFTTGRGSVTGNPVAPVIKIATNTPMYRRMEGDMDFNAGTVVDGIETVDEAAERLFSLILDVASGRVRTKSEQLRQRQFQLWREAGISV